MKSVLIGSTGSTEQMLMAMIETEFPVSYVFSVDEKYSKSISGYRPIHILAENNNIPFKKFKSINEKSNIEEIESINPDYIFVIGLSQLVDKRIINAANKGVIGFHPAPLPKMRGRAAIVWQILLGVRKSKCTLFFINEGIDSGDIIGQEPFLIDDGDYAIDVCNKIGYACDKLFRESLVKLKNNDIVPVKQDEAEATYLLKRTPKDGLINWNKPIKEIHTLVRAVSKPYPGAYGMYDEKHQLIIWKADIVENHKYVGLPGQIAQVTNDTIDVVCIDGILRISEYDNTDNIKIIAGHKL